MFWFIYSPLNYDVGSFYPLIEFVFFVLHAQVQSLVQILRDITDIIAYAIQI
jgi:hypothetical protein